MEKETAKKYIAECKKALERTDLTEEERSDIREEMLSIATSEVIRDLFESVGEPTLSIALSPRIKTCYSSTYQAATPTASMRKLAPVARQVVERGFAELVDPGSIDVEKLRRLHAPAYVDAFLTGKGSLASSQGWPWTPQIRDGVLAIQAGQLVGAQLALDHGIAANIAQGFHHAGYARGSGFCTFNGLALVAQEYPEKTICVLDCDEHGGNGTEEFIRRLPNLFQCTINGSQFGCKDSERSRCFNLKAITDDFEPYESALEKSFAQILQWKPDLLLYQAGADPHINDPYGSLGMTTEQMKQRDQMVFEFCAKNSISVLFVLAGGYQEPIETKLVPLHVNTFEAAAVAWKNKI